MYSDPVKVRQILFNLLTNAGKFTTRGRIILRAQALLGDLQTTVDTGWLQVEIEDTGIGIAPEHIERLFEDYAQAAPGITKQYGGTGLGLALSRRLARLLGGDIMVTSRLGIGSTFTLLLPGLLPDPAGAPPQ